jgi:Zn-dependent peptidase ImmA (M78 family)
MRTRREIEEKVASLLKQHSISGPSIAVDMIAVAEGLPIIEHTFAGDVAGALISGNGSSAIAVNSAQHLHRKRFTIAHELAHYLLGHQKDGEDHIDWKFSILRRDGKSSEGSDLKEIEANIFAANLLMPRQFLHADLTAQAGLNGEVDVSDELIQGLAKKYKVSERAMTFRLINLGFLAPE